MPYTIRIIDEESDCVIGEYTHVDKVNHKSTVEQRFDGTLKEAIQIYGDSYFESIDGPKGIKLNFGFDMDKIRENGESAVVDPDYTFSNWRNDG